MAPRHTPLQPHSLHEGDAAPAPAPRPAAPRAGRYVPIPFWYSPATTVYPFSYMDVNELQQFLKFMTMKRSFNLE